MSNVSLALELEGYTTRWLGPCLGTMTASLILKQKIQAKASQMTHIEKPRMSVRHKTQNKEEQEANAAHNF
jgi:hypothetical protein